MFYFSARRVAKWMKKFSDKAMIMVPCLVGVLMSCAWNLCHLSLLRWIALRFGCWSTPCNRGLVSCEMKGMS